MITTALLTVALLAATPADRTAAELAWSERAFWAIVHHKAEVDWLGAQEATDLIADAERMLRSQLPPARRTACLVLKHFGNMTHVPMLTRALRDGNDHVSAEAAVALGSISDKRSIQPIVAAFLRPGAGGKTKQACLVGLAAIAERTGATSEVAAALELLAKRTANPNDVTEIRRTMELVR